MGAVREGVHLARDLVMSPLTFFSIALLPRQALSKAGVES